MKFERRASPTPLVLASSAGAAIGLALTAIGWLWGIIPLLLGGAALIAVASGRSLALPRLAPDGARTPQTSAIVPALTRRPSRLAVAFMFVLGFAIGMVLDRLLMAAAGGNGDVLSALSAAIAESRLVETRIEVGGEVITVKHSELDIGQPADIFDGNFATLMRGKGDNPFIFEVRYAQPREARAVALDLATMEDYEIMLIVKRADGRSFTMREEGTTRLVDPSIEFSFPAGPQVIQSVRVEILDRRPPPQEGFHTHVRGFALR
ncbi:MAG: hypothetical protein RMN52_05395 [Anaerolineae bacterium]|nr:hypothetical protein [Candidatus Roseilinea sp.]MDW8449420.1 hypothetical protein [Anaerolineae bacterium]